MHYSSKRHMNESSGKVVVKALVSIAIVLALGFFTPMISGSGTGSYHLATAHDKRRTCHRLPLRGMGLPG